VNEIHDPAQAWNALTVGACTHKITINEAGTEYCVPVAKSGSLSPHSSTSLVWMNTQWPYKPDVVFEGVISLMILNSEISLIQKV
jgi:hypothetical protein